MVRVRFAPSPTGNLHIGSVRTAMFNWLFARHHNGTYLLRVEDTDVLRSKKEFLDSQLASLKWFNVIPDEPIVYQLARSKEHLAAAHELINKGFAYPCFCQPRDADEVVNDLDQGVGAKYAGICREKTFMQQDLQKPHAIRFKVPSDMTSVSFEDIILGTITVAKDQLDDFIIIRRDGTPIYNFCVVVDDIAMKITHVIRGQDHVSNTPKQILYYRALGAQEPKFAHIPLLLGTAGNKLSKRDASISVEEYRSQGFLAEALFNYLVRLGWSHGDQEIFTTQELIQYFDLDHVGKKGAIFDIKKLEWLNGVYMRKLSPDELLIAVKAMNETTAHELHASWSTETLAALIHEYKQRATTLVQLGREILSFAQDPEALDLGLIAKWHTEKTKNLLTDFVEQLEKISALSHDSLLALAKSVVDQHQEKLVNLAQPLRLALTGSTTSPGVFELITLLGKERSVQRIKTLCQKL